MPISNFLLTKPTRTRANRIVTKAIKDDAGAGRAARRRAAAASARCSIGAAPSLCRDRSAALLTVAHEVLSRYHAEKERRGLLDYDDLIDKTLELLGNVDAAWVHYKLDLGIDHVLIDEAQDTSSKQWESCSRLTAEFTAGAGARSVHAHDLRGRRREAVDLFVPERRAEGIRRDAAPFRARA